MRTPPLITDKPLGSAVRSAIGDEPVNVLVVGSARLAAALTKAGHNVRQWPGEKIASLFHAPAAELQPYEALVLVQVVGRRGEPLEDLSALVRAVRPRALVIVAEQAAWGRGGLWFGRLLGRLLGRPLVTDASELAALCLNAGLTGIRQTWPQGLRSLVLTLGRAHALARTLT